MKPDYQKLLRSIAVLLVIVTGSSLWLLSMYRQQLQNRELITTLVHGQTAVALVLVRDGADPDTPMKPTPVPPLLELVKQLLHLSPAPRNVSPTALQLACGFRWDNQRSTIEWQLHRPDSSALVGAMLDHGGKVNAKGKAGVTPLMQAVYLDHQDTVRLLLDRGADVNARRVDGWSALRYALVWHANDKDLIRLLMTHGANPNIPDGLGRTPLAFAQGSSPGIVALLR